MRRQQRGFNHESIQEMNRSLIISLLRQEGVCSRVHLANLSRLKQATITNIISQFIEWRLVKEVSFLTGNKGRRSIGIAINTDSYSVLGIRLSRRYYLMGLFDLTGKLKCEQRVDIAQEYTPRKIINSIMHTTQEMIDQHTESDILAIGMALPGPFIPQNGKIALMSESSEWNDLSIQEEMESTFGRPTFLEHDANAAVLAQLWHDKEIADIQCLSYIAAGQGIGAGILYNGQLLRGEMGIAGEIGHTSIAYDGPQCSCGNRGCLEKYCSSIAFVNKVNQALKDEKPYNLEQIQQMIDKQDALCTKEYRNACKVLGYGISNLVYNFNPGIVIIGDEMSHIVPSIMLEEVDKVLRQRILPVLYQNLEVKISQSVKNSALHGAGIVAISQVFANPGAFIGTKK